MLVDSMRALDRLCSRVASMLARCLTMVRARVTKAGMRQRQAQLIHRWRASLPASPLDGEDVPQASLEQLGAVQAGVGGGDPGQLGALVLGEVLAVLPQRVAGAFECPGPGVTRAWGRVGGGSPTGSDALGAGQRSGSVRRPWRRSSPPHPRRRG